MAGISPVPPSLPPPTGLVWKLVFSLQVSLGGGQEWHSQTFPLEGERTAALRCDADARFYAGLFSESEYVASRARSPLVFPFQRGSDRATYEQGVRPSAPTSYRVVLRVGAFAKAAAVRIGVWIAQPPAATPTPSSPPTEDFAVEAWRLRRGREIAYSVGAAVLVIAVWLLWYNVTLFQKGNLGLFDETLNAEATAVLAIVAVLGGLFAVWRELVVKPRQKRP